jgi:multidrug resistance efflux pump
MMTFAGFHVVRNLKATPPVDPPVAPAASPYTQRIAGAGIVEPQTENVSIGVAVPGVVQEVAVRVNQKVAAGDLLFRIDDRHLQAQLKARQADLMAAKATLAELESLPRAEEVPIKEAKLYEAEAALADLQDAYERAREMIKTKVIGDEEFVRRQQAYRVGLQQLAAARADLALLRAGAWEPRKAVARAAVAQAEAAVEQVKTEIERLVIRAPMAGEVLQVNVRPGEYVGTPPGQAFIVLGNLDRLHVRVDVDENDIPRFHPAALARAFPRGDASASYEMTFVRVEPYVIPKRSLTGDNRERVDTRVLQVIYAIKSKSSAKLFVGQQMDVFIDIHEPANGGASQVQDKPATEAAAQK